MLKPSQGQEGLASGLVEVSAEEVEVGENERIVEVHHQRLANCRHELRATGDNDDVIRGDPPLQPLPRRHDGQRETELRLERAPFGPE